MTHSNGWTLDDPSFEPFYARAAQLGLPVVLHPQLEDPPPTYRDWALAASLAPMVSSSLGVLRLILSGLLDRVPGLEVIVPHLGGTNSVPDPAAARLERQRRCGARSPALLSQPSRLRHRLLPPARVTLCGRDRWSRASRSRLRLPLPRRVGSVRRRRRTLGVFSSRPGGDSRWHGHPVVRARARGRGCRPLTSALGRVRGQAQAISQRGALASARRDRRDRRARPSLPACPSSSASRRCAASPRGGSAPDRTPRRGSRGDRRW